MADYNDLFNQYGQQYGLPEDALRVIATLESNMNPNARNPVSSAGGLFQFVDGTAPAYGLTGDKRYDPQEATRAAAQLARDNASYLENRLGRQPSVPELYLAHQQGMGGAAALLANPGQTAVGVLTRVYGGDANKARRAVVQNGGNVNMTAADFAGLWTNKASKVLGAPVPPANVGGGNAVATQLDTRRNITGSPTAMPASLGAQRQLTGQLLQGQQTAPNADFLRQFNAPYSAGETIGTVPTLQKQLQPLTNRRTAGQNVAAQRSEQGVMRDVASVGGASIPYGQGQTIGTVSTLPSIMAATSKTGSGGMSRSQQRADNGQTGAAWTGGRQSIPYSQGQTIGTVSTLPAVMSNGSNSANNINAQRSEQLGQRSATPQRATIYPTAQQLAANTGFRAGNLAMQPSTTPKLQDRLAPNPIVALMGSSGSSGANRAMQANEQSMLRQQKLAGGMQAGFTPKAVAKTGVTGFPTAANLRPGAMMAAAAQAQPVRQIQQQPLNVLVQGAQTQQPMQKQDPRTFTQYADVAGPTPGAMSLTSGRSDFEGWTPWLGSGSIPF